MHIAGYSARFLPIWVLELTVLFNSVIILTTIIKMTVIFCLLVTLLDTLQIIVNFAYRLSAV